MSERDAAALEFVGRGYEVAQYQLHRAVFAGRSPTVVSRFVARGVREGLLEARRTLGIGQNRLRLTRSGLRFLQKLRPETAKTVFVPRRPVAAKDVEHTTFINDVCVALQDTEPGPTEIYPAWYLQRQLGAEAVAVPDVLALWRNNSSRDSLVLAFEVDLGAEPLNRVFIPKLVRLAEVTSCAVPLAQAAIFVFTRGKRRRSMLEEAFSEVTFHAAPLPAGTGVDSIEYFEEAIRSLVGPLLYAAGSPNAQTSDVPTVAYD